MSTRILTVSEVNYYIKVLLQNDLLLSGVSVKGEVSNYRPHSSGHMYFTLKDHDSRIKCVMFRGNASKMKFSLEDGMSVIVRGNFSLYERDGQYQLYADEIVPDGVGVLYKAFEQLKLKLSQEGLFDEAGKKSLPYLPATIGIVTSPTGAAIRDMISIIKRRCPFVNILIYPALVQGEGAAQEVVEGIRFFNGYKNADVIIIGRGGGSIEELWAFNEEVVARALQASDIPVISAVGHETDFTIADFTADLRAATPSVAAELVVPDIRSLYERHKQARYNLNVSMNMYLSDKKSKLEALSKSNSFKQIERKILNLSQTLDFLNKSLHYSMQSMVKDKKNLLINSIEKLNILNPAAALLRGYAYVKKEDAIVTSIKQVNVDDALEISLMDGKIIAEVKQII